MAHADNKDVSFCQMFEWTEKIPRIGQKGDIFRDRIFTAFNVKFSASFSYEDGTMFFKIKAISGTELLTDFEMKKLTYSNVREFAYRADQKRGKILRKSTQLNSKPCTSSSS